MDHLYAPDDPEAVLQVMTRPNIRVVSLTVTEGGYNIDAVTGHFDRENPVVLADIAAGAGPTTMFGYVVEALRRRRALGVPPFTVVSCDNLEGNGRVARSSILAFAGLRDPELAGSIGREVKFPNSMVDRITPITTPEDVHELQETFGIGDARPVVCEPFVQWVLEDDYVTARPPLEEVGVQLTHDVGPYELINSVSSMPAIRPWRIAVTFAATPMLMRRPPTRCSQSSCSATWTRRPARRSKTPPGSTRGIMHR